MQIFVNTFAGKEITLDVEACYTVDDVKAKILCQEGIPLEDQRLIWIGEQLEGHRMLASYKIRDQSKLLLLRNVSGGGGGGGGLREWSRHVRRRQDSNEDYQQPRHPPAGSPPSTPFARPVPNGEIVSQGLVEFREIYSWHHNSLDWTETCARCQARWECFPVLPGHPLGIKEAVIHMGGQVGEGSYDVTCGMCNVTWHARVVPVVQSSSA